MNRSSSEAKANWNTLKKSQNVHTIHLNEKDENGNIKQETVQKEGYKSKGSGGSGGGTDIFINLNKTTSQGQELGTNIIGIGHEEGYAFRFDQGLVADDYVSNMKDPNDSAKMLIHIGNVRRTEEIEVSHIENIIRAQVDPTGTRIPLRKTYDNLPVYNRDPATGRAIRTTESPNVIKEGYDYYKTP